MAKLRQLQVARTVRPLCLQSRAAATSKLLQQKTPDGSEPPKQQAASVVSTPARTTALQQITWSLPCSAASPCPLTNSATIAGRLVVPWLSCNQRANTRASSPMCGFELREGGAESVVDRSCHCRVRR